MEPVGLFEAFREDHAILGRGFHELSALLRTGDVAGAKQRAARLDREAGSHIAFEEQAFYPLLRELLGPADTDRLYHEHDAGLEVLRALAALPERFLLIEEERLRLLGLSEAMESHIAECGELFEVMGRIPPGKLDELLDSLRRFREQAPRWTELAGSRRPP